VLKIKLICYIIDSMEAGKGFEMANKAQPWDDSTKKKRDRPFVSCTEDYEIENEAKKYHVSKDIIKECCEEIPAPHPRKDFEECIKSKKRKSTLLGEILMKILSK